MTWNYRVIEHDVPSEKHPKGFDFETWYAIHEVYYAPDGERIVAMTEMPTDVSTTDQDEFPEILAAMREAIDKPVVQESSLLEQSERGRADLAMRMGRLTREEETSQAG